MPTPTKCLLTVSPADAISALKQEQVIGFPTETVYGLAADGLNEAAVNKIFEIKGRPTGHPLILHLGAASWITRYCTGNIERAEKLAASFCPGPLTMVLHKKEGVPFAVSGGLSTVAVRVPAHPMALAVLLGLDRPLAAPSANKFGAVSPTTARHVSNDLGALVSLVLDGGTCDKGIESTIVDLTREDVRVLRPGSVGIEEIEKVLDCRVLENDGAGPIAPGTLASHYSPRAQLVVAPAGQLMDIAQKHHDLGCRVGVMLHGSLKSSVEPEILVVSLGASPEEIAHELYAAMRQLDERGCDTIVVELPSSEGVGGAVVDRILRAAADRPLD